MKGVLRNIGLCMLALVFPYIIFIIYRKKWWHLVGWSVSMGLLIIMIYVSTGLATNSPSLVYVIVALAILVSIGARIDAFYLILREEHDESKKNEKS